MLPAEIVFLGTYEKCLEIRDKLKDGSMTEQEAKALDDEEKLYIISDSTYLHLQRTDSGFNYTLYDKETHKLIDGGQLNCPEQHIYSVCLAVCNMHGLDGYKVRYAPVEFTETLQEAQTQAMDAEILPLPDPVIPSGMILL